MHTWKKGCLLVHDTHLLCDGWRYGYVYRLGRLLVSALWLLRADAKGLIEDTYGQPSAGLHGVSDTKEGRLWTTVPPSKWKGLSLCDYLPMDLCSCYHHRTPTFSPIIPSHHHCQQVGQHVYSPNFAIHRSAPHHSLQNDYSHKPSHHHLSNTHHSPTPKSPPTRPPAVSSALPARPTSTHQSNNNSHPIKQFPHQPIIKVASASSTSRKHTLQKRGEPHPSFSSIHPFQCVMTRRGFIFSSGSQPASSAATPLVSPCDYLCTAPRVRGTRTCEREGCERSAREGLRVRTDVLMY